MRRFFGVITLTLVCVALCLSCAGPRYQSPQSAQQFEHTVTTTEQAYKALYTEHTAQRLSKTAMVRVDEIYQAWRHTQGLLIDAVRAGAVTVAPE